MNTPEYPSDKASNAQAAHLLDRLRAGTVRRAADERNYTTALKRKDANHLTAVEAVRLARNMDCILTKRKAQIGRRLGKLCEEAFGATSSKELYKLRLPEEHIGTDRSKELRRTLGPYRLLAEAVAALTEEPPNKVLRELMAETRFDQLQSKVARWDRIDAVAAHLKDLVDRLNDEFMWDKLYERVVQVRLESGGKLTWPLQPNDYYESAEPETFENKLLSSLDPTRMFYSGSPDHAVSSYSKHFFENDQLQDENFFFVPHARVGYVVAWDLPLRTEDPLGYHKRRAEEIAWQRQAEDGLKEPEIAWDDERKVPKGHVDGGAHIYCGPTTQSYVWLIAYPSPLRNESVVPALYRPGEDTGAWLMPLDRKSLVAVEDGIWLDNQCDSSLLERLEILLGADQTDGICPLERDLRLTGSWLAHNPVLAWEARQRERQKNMLDRARRSPRGS